MHIDPPWDQRAAGSVAKKYKDWDKHGFQKCFCLAKRTYAIFTSYPEAHRVHVLFWEQLKPTGEEESR